MKKLLVGFFIMVLLCGGVYLAGSGAIKHVQQVAQWPEKRGAEAAKLCHTGETLKITISDNGGDTLEDFDCEDEQGNRRNVTETVEDKAPRLVKRWGVFVGIGMVIVAAIIGFVAFMRATAEDGQSP
ncbi:MAG: hypothetical protein DPW16_10585 [Chloroflexi bacterium]|nr:hypothetical protein [Chloroflexota bacterium]